ncbi:NAD-aldehyde dehydrogenase [Pseudohyphozyma bogoriensis]|nr:NAD-aldehyde dehydrogenase [Pseudohyphozyma bogoriensis]
MAIEPVKTISPADGSVVVTRARATQDEIDQAISVAQAAQKEWKKTALDERLAIGEKFVQVMEANRADVGKEITEQMGRPISQSAGEVGGLAQRARHMLSIAKEALADVEVENSSSFKRSLRRVPVGVAFIVTPWNYPMLAIVNSIIPAIISGNSVLLMPSPQTPLAGERFAAAFKEAGLPDGVLQVLHLDGDQILATAANKAVSAVSFTGSTVNGHNIAKAAAEGFKGITLELGGKDAGYVRADADLDYSVEQLVDGAMFNSGQCCCGIERIYVEESVYEPFVEKFVEAVKGYRLGDPRDPNVNIGPVVSTRLAGTIREHIAEAVELGAKSLVPESHFPAAKEGTTYVAPTVLVDVNHKMKVMVEETFGPVVGIQKVKGDEEALELMNDSTYGLTASIWTDVNKSADAVNYFVDGLETGIVFANRCDYGDPGLAWCGQKDTGVGQGLGKYGFESFTRLKAVHLKVVA